MKKTDNGKSILTRILVDVIPNSWNRNLLIKKIIDRNLDSKNTVSKNTVSYFTSRIIGKTFSGTFNLTTWQ